MFEAGAVLNGSKLVTNWTLESGRWVSTGHTQSFGAVSGVPCDLNPAACEHEDLFRDDLPLVRVLSLTELSSGEFYFDETADRMYVADDPTGHKMEAPVTGSGIESPGVTGVTVRGATVEKFALHGIVTSSGWTIDRVEVRYVHSHGLRVFGTSSVLRSYIHHAGNMGIFGQGTNLLFDTNHLAFNNYLNFGRVDGMWHAGATKIIQSNGTVVRNNWSHDNLGDGWWLDWNNINNVVENNRFENNTRFGFFYEASFDGIVRNNVFRNNGRDVRDFGAGLMIATSKNVEVVGNTFVNNGFGELVMTWTSRGTHETLGERQTSNTNVHDNTLLVRTSAVRVPYGDARIYSSGNRFEGNDFLAYPFRALPTGLKLSTCCSKLVTTLSFL